MSIRCEISSYLLFGLVWFGLFVMCSCIYAFCVVWSWPFIFFFHFHILSMVSCSMTNAYKFLNIRWIKYLFFRPSRATIGYRCWFLFLSTSIPNWISFKHMSLLAHLFTWFFSSLVSIVAIKSECRARKKITENEREQKSQNPKPVIHEQRKWHPNKWCVQV